MAAFFFYQNELPYDVTQENFGNPGFSGYQVAQNVLSHNAYGVGVYSYFRDYVVETPSAILAPTRPGIVFVSPFTRFLNGLGAITHILNDLGNPVNDSHPLAYLCP